jgi:hypothetical protein
VPFFTQEEALWTARQSDKQIFLVLKSLGSNIYLQKSKQWVSRRRDYIHSESNAMRLSLFLQGKFI